MEKDILSKLEVARLIALQRLGILPESEERRLSAWVERDEKNKAFYEQLRQKSFDENAITIHGRSVETYSRKISYRGVPGSNVFLPSGGKRCRSGFCHNRDILLSYTTERRNNHLSQPVSTYNLCWKTEIKSH
ncbi:MAG: hypothetical protein ACLU4J_19015 [Butyricimonas paravirosa]